MNRQDFIQEAFKKLLKKYKTHTAVAIAIGYTREHYRAMRNNRVNITPNAEKLIIFEASKCNLPFTNNKK